MKAWQIISTTVGWVQVAWLPLSRAEPQCFEGALKFEWTKSVEGPVLVQSLVEKKIRIRYKYKPLINSTVWFLIILVNINSLVSRNSQSKAAIHRNYFPFLSFLPMLFCPVQPTSLSQLITGYRNFYFQIFLQKCLFSQKAWRDQWSKCQVKNAELRMCVLEGGRHLVRKASCRKTERRTAAAALPASSHCTTC